MNKQAVIVVALLGISGFGYAEEAVAKGETVQVTVTSEMRVDKDMVEDVMAEAKEDAKALKEKYEPVCGIDTVKTTVKRSASDDDEKVTKSCSKCKCSCKGSCSGSCCKCRTVRSDKGDEEEKATKSCSKCKCSCKTNCSGSCCSCRSVTIEDDNCCDAHVAEGTRVACEACEKIKEGNRKKRERQAQLERERQQQNKSVRSINEDGFCTCQIVQEKCADCGEVNAEFRCNCGKPKQTDVEPSRCNCGKPKTNDEEK